MLPDFGPVFAGQKTALETISGIAYTQLPTLTDELFDAIASIISGATDATVVLVPTDPALAGSGEQGWTLGHVIVHLTAGIEESAVIASTLARSAPVEGRPRYETPWESVTTVAQVQQRLAESRRMAHAFLSAWPDTPNLEATYVPFPQIGSVNAIARYLLGLTHANGHLEQLREIMRQATTV